MSKNANRKPTMKEMKLAVTNIIRHMTFLQNRIDQLDSVLAGYFEFKEDHQTFPGWFKEKVAKRKEKDESEQSTVRTSTEGDKKTS